MSKKDIFKQYQPIAYASACGGIEVYHIEYDIEDFVYCTSNSWDGIKQYHKVKIYYSNNPYIIINGYRIRLNDVIRIF